MIENQCMYGGRQVLVSVGKRVNADEPLCVVVAMKMEVVVKAPVAGAYQYYCGLVLPGCAWLPGCLVACLLLDR
jgi:hypothetical protein